MEEKKAGGVPAEEERKPVIRLYNSMSKEKEVFEPMEEGKVRMYVCGVTPYDFSHVGHARAYVAFDVLHRYLKHLGYEVIYVRNFTDIDDKPEVLETLGFDSPIRKWSEASDIDTYIKIIKRANEASEDPLVLSERFSNEFLHDMDELQCLPPTHQPKVSDHLDQIKDMISKIIDNGCGYTIDGDVYFSVDNFPEYCCLSRRKLDDNRAGGGGRVNVDLRKRNPADFALWKSAKPGEPRWDSPWGPGRPGWHIECSAMSAHYLGHSFDIHGGGMDLVFPHHENEIAQSRAACPESKVNYWMHNGFVNKDNQKMSKSDNNFFTIRDIIASYHPLALRFFLMRTHYRSDVNYSDRLLDTASDHVFYIYQTLHRCEVALTPFLDGSSKFKVSKEAQEKIKGFRKDFLDCMSDDLHTTTVLDKLRTVLLKAINDTLDNKFKGKQQQQKSVPDLKEYENEVKRTLDVLGLQSSSTCFQVLEQLKARALKRAGLTEELLQQLIEERTLARNGKEYEKTDRMRKELEAKGIQLMDEGKVTTWRPCELPDEPSGEQAS